MAKRSAPHDLHDDYRVGEKVHKVDEKCMPVSADDVCQRWQQRY